MIVSRDVVLGFIPNVRRGAGDKASRNEKKKEVIRSVNRRMRLGSAILAVAVGLLETSVLAKWPASPT